MRVCACVGMTFRIWRPHSAPSAHFVAVMKICCKPFSQWQHSFQMKAVLPLARWFTTVLHHFGKTGHCSMCLYFMVVGLLAGFTKIDEKQWKISKMGNGKYLIQYWIITLSKIKNLLKLTIPWIYEVLDFQPGLVPVTAYWNLGSAQCAAMVRFMRLMSWQFTVAMVTGWPRVLHIDDVLRLVWLSKVKKGHKLSWQWLTHWSPEKRT